MNGFQKSICEDALNKLHCISDWEKEFVESLLEHEDYPLSEKQNSILNRIAQKL